MLVSGREPEQTSRVGPEAASKEAALAAWRRKAADVALTVGAIGLLLPCIWMPLGRNLRVGLPVRGVYVITYAVMAVMSLLRRVEYRLKLKVFFVTVFLSIGIANVALPHGPYAQIAPVALPILVLVVCGPRSARIAIFASAIIIVSTPLLRTQPWVLRTLAIDPTQLPARQVPLGLQTVVRIFFLVALMTTLTRFHRFLMDALNAEWQARTALEREIAERITAQNRLEEEMRERCNLEREITGIADEERRRLGRELHDGVCQLVTAASLHCRALQHRLEKGGPLSGGDFVPVSSLLAEALEDAHKVAVGLCPLNPDSDALVPALKALTTRVRAAAAVSCEFITSGDVRVANPTWRSISTGLLRKQSQRRTPCQRQPDYDRAARTG